MIKINSATLLLLSTMLPILMYARSAYRPQDPDDPVVNVWDPAQPGLVYSFYDSHFEEIIFKLFDKNHFYTHLLPTHPICYRYDQEQSVLGSTLSKLIQNAIGEIIQLPPNKQPNFSAFTILKMRDVNHYSHTGVYVLKFKDYPFVVKLFIESPAGFFRIGDKGFEPLCFYYMGGGINRHLTGFTRLKNLEQIKLLITQNPVWHAKVDFPRKWFWVPASQKWISFEGKNIGPQPRIKATVPAIYAIICDEILWEEPFVMTNADHRYQAITLSNFLEHRIDLHITNFGREKNSKKIVTIDYEHFPTFVGLKQTMSCTTYTQWFTHLAKKMVQDILFRNKDERRFLQKMPYRDQFTLCSSEKAVACIG